METPTKLIQDLLDRINMSCVGNRTFSFRVARDPLPKAKGRIFIQVQYKAPCVKTGTPGAWRGRKWYLSDHMTEDEVIKTAFAAFRAAIEHEVLEGFKVDGKALFNPHISYRELLKISTREVKRRDPAVDKEAIG